MDRLVFVTQEMYGCACCNKKRKVIVLYDYYDTSLAPYCASCFVAKMVVIFQAYSKVVGNIEMQYKDAEKMNSSNVSSNVSISYDVYKSVLSDNDKLREEIKDLKIEVENWKKASVENHNAYLSAMSGYEDYQNKYIQEKMDHTTTKCRAVYAKKILSGERDEKLILQMEKSEF